ncbi:MAG: alpha-L-arabinofuranosidase [Armatimonadetes bacterium]|nr:alpha-L-arabinofuranosidase [Armatimonadota bacterium]
MLASAILLLAMPALAPSPQTPNPFSNPGFERIAQNGGPAAWRTQGWGGQARYAIVDGGRGGGLCAMVESDAGVDGGWQTSATVRPFSTYRLTAWIKTDGIAKLTGQGALINLHGRPEHTSALTGTNDWTKVQMDLDTGADDSLLVNCLVGYYGTAKGKAWFDDLSLELLKTKEMKPEATIDLSKTKDPISKYIYGQFIEHLGRCIYGGIWAEMLQDRKFFYAPSSKDSPWKSSGNGFTLDTIDPLSGEHSIGLVGGETSTTLSQSGLALTSGQKYVGYLWVRPGAGQSTVSVSLGGQSHKFKIEPQKPKDPQAISPRTQAWRKVPFEFRAKTSMKDATLELKATGDVVSIGPVSLMPADNVRGMRKDTLKLLKDLNSPVYRWPGGNFVSGYNWRDGLGDRDKRPTRKNPAWQGIDSNDFGLHEFIDFCKEIGTEPEVVVNTGLGKLEWATEQLAYCNAPASSPMGKQRAANGHPKPFNVKWWGIGNEMYGDWQLGHVTLDEYTKRHNQYVQAMRKVDPSIKVIAVGENNWDWTRGMFTNCADNIDLISEHFYCQERPSVFGHVGQIAEQIRRKANNHRELMKTIPAMKGKKVQIAMDEWNYWYGPHVFGELGTRYFWKDGMGIAKGLHEFFRNTDAIFMAMYAQTVNVIGAIKTTQTDAEMETTGLVLQLYRQHFGTIPVEVGGAPDPLDVSAAFTSDRKAFTLAIVNPMPDKVTFPLKIKGVLKTTGGTQWVMTNSDPMAYNDPGKPRKVDFVQRVAQPLDGQITVDGYSVTLIRYKL